MTSRVVVAGAGMAGFTAAQRLERITSPEEVEITVVNPTNSVVYPPLLPEVAGGTIEPSQAVSSLRVGLSRSHLVVGEVCELHMSGDGDGTGDGSAGGEVILNLHDGGRRRLPFDHLLVTFGSVSRLMPVPGLVDVALGFTTLTEARHARERVIERLEAAAATTDPEARRRALTFMVVGGGYTGVEAIGELQELSRVTAETIPGLSPDELRWYLVEATGSVLTMVGPRLADLVTDTLRGRGIDLRLETVVESVDSVDGRTVVVLSDGTTIATDTVWWCAGVVGHPAIAGLGLPTDAKGRVPVGPTGEVRDRPGLWAAGDGAAFPDLVTGGLCPPSAQYAVRQGRHVAANIARAVRGQDPVPFRYRSKGELLTLGRRYGVAEVYGRQLTGWPAWYLRRLYHLVAIPNWRRKIRLWIDWTTNRWLPTEAVTVGEERPRDPILHAARTQHLTPSATRDE